MADLMAELSVAKKAVTKVARMVSTMGGSKAATRAERMVGPKVATMVVE